MAGRWVIEVGRGPLARGVEVIDIQKASLTCAMLSVRTSTLFKESETAMFSAERAGPCLLHPRKNIIDNAQCEMRNAGAFSVNVHRAKISFFRSLQL